jgi:hypothetical protein
MNLAAKIKARVDLPEIAAVLGLGFPSRIWSQVLQPIQWNYCVRSRLGPASVIF